MSQNTAHAEKTKLKMAAALKELMKTCPFEKITVLDITNKSNIHRQTFYYHFEDRYELLDWMLYYELILPFITDFKLTNIYLKVYNLFSTMLDDREFYQNALKVKSDDLSKHVSKVAAEGFIDVIKSVGKENNIEASKNSDIVIAEFFGFGLSGVVTSWARNGMKESPKEMSDRIKSLVDACQQLAIKTK